MKVCILMGSPHPVGNTASLSRLFVEALSQNGCAVSALALYNLDLRPCIGWADTERLVLDIAELI